MLVCRLGKSRKVENMATLESRLQVLEQNRGAPAGAWLDMIVLHEGEEMTAHQLSECERAAKHNLPSLIVTIEGAHYGHN